MTNFVFQNIPFIKLSDCPHDDKLISVFWNNKIICLYDDNGIFREIELWHEYLNREDGFITSYASFSDDNKAVKIITDDNVIKWIETILDE